MFAEYKQEAIASLRPMQTEGLVKGFAICKLGSMEQPLTVTDQIVGLRRELGLNQAEFALRIGLANKASVSLLERGGPCSLPVALAIETLSAGRIDAAALNEDVRAARAGSARQPEAAEPFTEARVIVCDVCGHRVDGGVPNACTFVDCPHSPRWSMGEAA